MPPGQLLGEDRGAGGEEGLILAGREEAGGAHRGALPPNLRGQRRRKERRKGEEEEVEERDEEEPTSACRDRPLSTLITRLAFTW